MIKDRRSLFDAAVNAAKNAYADYSGFRVGAALLTASGDVITGCNIENASYSLTICAERTAIFKAVSDGITDFAAIAIAGSSTDDFTSPCVPCGACLQVMREFCSGDLPIILADGEHKLSDLLPCTFNKESIG